MSTSWVPLENNPEVLNTYLSRIGVKAGKAEFTDVYGVSEELLSMVPLPVYAVLFVFPVTEETERRGKEVTSAQKTEVEAFMRAHPFFYTKQYTENACGTIAVLHALLNNVEQTGPFEEGSVVASLCERTVKANGTPEAVGAVIRDDLALAQAHAEASADGTTAQPDGDEPVDLHFVCFVPVAGRCVELDGRQANPILHGAYTTNAEFLSAAGAAIQEKMSANPSSFEFSITALVGNSD